MLGVAHCRWRGKKKRAYSSPPRKNYRNYCKCACQYYSHGFLQGRLGILYTVRVATSYPFRMLSRTFWWAQFDIYHWSILKPDENKPDWWFFRSKLFNMVILCSHVRFNMYECTCIGMDWVWYGYYGVWILWAPTRYYYILSNMRNIIYNTGDYHQYNGENDIG